MNPELLATYYWRSAWTLDHAEPLLALIALENLTHLARQPGRIGRMAAGKVALHQRRQAA